MNPNKVCASFQGRGLKASLLRSGSGSILLRVLVFALSLLMTVVLARALGAKGYGVYAYAMAIVTLLAIPAQVGLPTIIVRETARAEANDRWGLIRGLWGWSGKLVLALSAVLVVIAFFVAWLGRESHDSLQLQTFYAALPLIPLMALGSVRGAALRGLRHVIKGQLPESVLRPSFLIVMILFVYVLLAESVTPKEAMMLHSAAAALAFIVGAYMLRRARPDGLIQNPAPEYEAKYWRRSILPLSMIGGANVINAQADIVMLGWMTSSEDVGIYRVVAASVLMINFGKQAIVSVVSPFFSRMYAKSEMQSLQALVTKSNQVVFLLSLPAFLVFLLAGEAMLGLIFGEEFSAGYVPLVILSLGYVFGMTIGSVSALLNMTGHEKYTAISVGMSAVLNIVLNLLLIPVWGIAGAATAMAVSMVISNSMLWVIAVRQLGIKSGIFGSLSRAK